MQYSLPFALPLAAALVLCISGTSALADSTSSAASSASTSLGSSSASIQKSSDSSSSKDKVAQGHYTITDMVAVADQPDMLRLTLQAARTDAAPADTFELLLPRPAAEKGQLTVGQTVAAEHKAYGIAFATLDAAGQARPFFLVLDDAWHRELQSRPVGT